MTRRIRFRLSMRPGHSQEDRNQTRNMRRWIPKTLCLAAAVLFPLLPFSNAVSQQLIGCSDIRYLIEQSRSQFVEIRGSSGGDFGDYDATFVLPDAWFCLILEDVEKWSYRCVWKYPHGDAQANTTFQRFVREMRNCIGTIAEERADQSVNHPDFYASSYFRLSGGAASVSLKNKAKLMSTLVSIRIDGFTMTK